MRRHDHATDRVLALVLKAGAYLAFVLVVAGLCLRWAATVGGAIATAGLLVLLATPVLRIVVACVQFSRERDLKYALVSLGVLLIVVLAYFLGIQA